MGALKMIQLVGSTYKIQTIQNLCVPIYKLKVKFQSNQSWIHHRIVKLEKKGVKSLV